MALRLGDLLVSRGVLSVAQRDAVLEAQRATSRPFGELAERMFGLSERQVEDAWAAQYAASAPRIDPLGIKPESEALAMIDGRQAWQFRVLPVRYDGHELEVCTTPDNLARALRFVGWRIERACFMVISEARPLARAIAKHYPMAGTSPDALMAHFEDLLGESAA